VLKDWKRLTASALLLILPTVVRGDEPSAKSVVEIQTTHDRALIRDLSSYIAENPKADDLDQAYMTLFEKAIEHDWFTENESLAKRYLAEHPDGPVKSLAQIIGVMARAQVDDFSGALSGFNELMAGLGKPDQEDFAAKFADSLASTAAGAGEVAVARKVYQTLLDRYGECPTLRQKIKDDLHRLDLVGSPAPSIVAKDVKGDPFRLENLRGKYVLVDFWATWCAPCVAELPRMQGAFAKYHDKGFEIVSVSLDESKVTVVDFAKARNLPWRQIHNASSEGDMVEGFGVGTIPATFLIDPNGVIIRLELRGPALDAALAKLLGGTDPKKLARPER
jgi:peroxiredoxin